jgi:nicotinate phosphoribosyltransferase
MICLLKYWGEPTSLNIVLKLSLTIGNPAIKINNNIGKNTGDNATVEKARRN